MSSGYLSPQEKGEHQVILFTFTGKITAAEKKAWNQQILALKKKFGNRVVAITLTGEKTPRNPGT